MVEDRYILDASTLIDIWLRFPKDLKARHDQLVEVRNQRKDDKRLEGYKKLEEIRRSVEAGASEIDIVISRELVLNNKWEELYHEVRLCREACGSIRAPPLHTTRPSTNDVGTTDGSASPA